MKTLIVELTDEQYNRFAAALQKLTNNEEITEADMIAQLRREASAVTYAAEITPGSTGADWKF
jgi:hypothetical protein